MRPAGLRQYLERHATAEAALGRQLRERYRAVLVVPAHREAPGFTDGYRAAFESAGGPVLVVVVVNAAAPHAASHWPEHELLLASLRGEGAEELSREPPAWISRHGLFDVLSIDRAHPDHCFPEREGVGLARRMGCDVALAAFAAGQIEDEFIYCTDADAELPQGYFDGQARAVAPDVSCLVFDFWHVAGGDAAIDAATAIYELGLRYYVSGLAFARSPFAHHSIGSSLAVRAPSYAAVRGFPRRLSGEDFYLLNKAAKVGRIWRDDTHTIHLASRASSRTVHGTGAAAIRLAQQPDAESTPFYHPAIFSALAEWLSAMERFARERDVHAARAAVVNGAVHACVDAALEELGAWQALSDAAEQTRGPDALRQRLHTWFDGFRTLKLLHALRQRAFPSLPFREALEKAPFLPSATHAGAPVDVLRRAFADEQTRLPVMTGVGAPNG